MHSRWLWPILKHVLAALIVGVVGWQFYRDLSRLELADLTLRPSFLFLSGVLYLLGLACSAWYWHHLLQAFGQRPTRLAALRAYYLGHLGKYIPGKAWALLLRAGAIRGPDTRFGVAILSSFYEVLTTMAAGALVAAVSFVIIPPEVPGLSWPPLLTGLGLLALCIVPLLPAVFNRLVARLARQFESVKALETPRLRLPTLLLGLLMTASGWSVIGLSVWALFQAVMPTPPPLSLALWVQLTGSIALAYVVGFLVLPVPSGVGVREFFLLELLSFLAPTSVVAAAVLLLRLVWTAAELLSAGVLYPFGAERRLSQAADGERPSEPDS